MNFEEIEQQRVAKLKANGTFDHECYVHHIEVSEDNKRVIEYLENKKRPYVYTHFI